MKITFFPKTKLGIESVILLIAGLVFFTAGSVLGPALPYAGHYSGFAAIVHNPLTSAAAILYFASLIASAVTGILSVIKKQEHSIAVFLALGSGVMSLPMIFGDVYNLFFK